MAEWPDIDTRSGDFFEGAKYRIEKEPDKIGYYVWKRTLTGAWTPVQYYFTWWGAKLAVKRALTPPKPKEESKFWYF